MRSANTEVPSTAAAGSREVLQRAIAVAVVVAGCTLFVARWSARSYFVFDDFYNFSSAHAEGLSAGYLLEPVFPHLAPGYRLVNWAVQRFAPLDWTLTQAAMLTLYAGCVLLVYLIIVELYARDKRSRFGPLVLTVLGGVAIAPVSTLQWWASALHQIPSLFFSLLAVLAWLRYDRSRRLSWLIASLGSMALGLSFYGKAALVPLYLVLIRLLLMAPGQSIAGNLRSVVRAWRVWLAYGATLGIYLTYYIGFTNRPGINPAGVRDTLRYVGMAWTRSFVPGVIGFRLEQHVRRPGDLFALVLANVLFVVIVVVSLVRSRRAWRAWAFFEAVWLLNTLLIGIPRLIQFGDPVAFDQRYYTEQGLLLSIALGAAFLWPADHRAFGRIERRASGAVVVAVVLVTTMHLWVAYGGARRISEHWPGHASGQYVRNLVAGIEAVGDGPRPVPMVEGTVPSFVMEDWLDPHNRYSELVSLTGLRVEFGQLRDPMYAPDEAGRLWPVDFDPVLSAPTRTWEEQGSLTVGNEAAASSDGEVCVTGYGYIEFTVPVALQAQPSWWLALDYASPVAVELPVFVDRGSGYPAVADRHMTMYDATSGTTLTWLGGPAVEMIRVDVPEQHSACFGTLAVGQLSRR